MIHEYKVKAVVQDRQLLFFADTGNGQLDIYKK